MTRFKARKSNNGLFEILGLDKWAESKLAALRREIDRRLGRGAAAESEDSLDVILKAFDRHPMRAELVKAGRGKDQLLRSLIPLYVVCNMDVEVNSGDISRFWKMHGVRYATPNAAKALREHVGFARVKGGGRQITPNGIKHVEEKLFARRAA